MNINNDNIGRDEQKEQIVTPWIVTSKTEIDYMKLIDKFGSTPLTGELIERFEKVTGKKIHPWIRRGLVFSHRDMDKILDSYEKGEIIYQYTGRGATTESMHLGHMIPFMLCKYLQDALDTIVIIQMSDDEKYYFKDGMDLEELNRLAYKNSKDIIACGFNPDKTFIFSNLETVGGSLYKNIVHIMKHTTGNQIKGIYGLNLDNSVGQLSWPCFQSAPAFSNSFPQIFGDKHIPCLVTMAIDQDPYFRMARDFADRFSSKGYIKPSVLHTKFLPSLQGTNSKMSSSTNSPTIFLTDTHDEIKQKIRSCFSGGCSTKKEHLLNGANLLIDVPYQYLLYFMHDDDKLHEIASLYHSGKMMTSEIKTILVSLIYDFILNHQQSRNSITNDQISHFFNPHRYFDFTIQRKDEISNTSTNFDNSGINFDAYFGLY